MTSTIVLIHGAWVTTRSWDLFRQPFEAAGYTVLTPTWPPFENLPAEALRRKPPRAFGGLSIGQIVDHLQWVIQRLPEPPILVGHSFGGLFVQLLLDRGVGIAGVAINPAPIGGIVADLTAIRAILPVVCRLSGWNRPYAFSPDRFARLYATGAPPEVIRQALDTYVIPTSGKILHQAASWLGTRINPRHRMQPLLITGSDNDRLVSPYLSKAAFTLQKKSSAPTDYVFFEGQSHLLIGEPGYEKVAQAVLNWLRQRLPEHRGNAPSSLPEATLPLLHVPGNRGEDPHPPTVHRQRHNDEAAPLRAHGA